MSYPKVVRLRGLSCYIHTAVLAHLIGLRFGPYAVLERSRRLSNACHTLLASFVNQVQHTTNDVHATRSLVSPPLSPSGSEREDLPL